MKSQRIPLDSSVFLTGRRECLCEASDHALINNCTNCGRIVCEQEGSGPCFTCNSLVCTNIEMDILSRDSKESAKLRQKLMGNYMVPSDRKFYQDSEKLNQQLHQAIEHKNKLLEFNDTVAKRTKVIDDECDYYNMDSNKWLSTSVRKAFEKKMQEREEARHGSRINKKITFDFAGREIEDESYDLDVEELLKDDTSIFEYKDFIPTEGLEDYVPEYMETPSFQRHKSYTLPAENKTRRIQDKELQFMSDDGMCLSVNQPYASLIVAGIKKHEGRNWFTSFRGRLWIHASQKQAAKDVIDNVQKSYRHILGEETKFPLNYPTGTVVGCVDLTECLTQEEYTEQYPKGEIASPFIFIFENAQELKVKFPMKGGKKIFKMESNFHNAAKKTLQKVL